jgi:hypothetical protein
VRVPQFFLNVCDGRYRHIDPRGYEFASLEQARSAAIQVAREVAEDDRLVSGALDAKRIEIADAEGHTLVTVPVREALRN